MGERLGVKLGERIASYSEFPKLIAIINIHVVHKNVLDGSSMIKFPLVLAVSELDMPGIEPGHITALTNELQEVINIPEQLLGPDKKIGREDG